jgi:hypothetical protein
MHRLKQLLFANHVIQNSISDNNAEELLQILWFIAPSSQELRALGQSWAAIKRDVLRRVALDNITCTQIPMEKRFTPKERGFLTAVYVSRISHTW